MKMQHVKTSELIPYVNNARTHSEEQVSQIAASIREFGFNNPILIKDDKTVIAGHGRLLAARKLGLEEVPCIYLSHLSEIQAKAYIIADNKLAENAKWDNELLKIELDSVKLADIDLSALGFSDDDIDDLYAPLIDISPVDEFNTTFSFSIKCDTPAEFEEIKSAFGVQGKSITANHALEILSEHCDT